MQLAFHDWTKVLWFVTTDSECLRVLDRPSRGFLAKFSQNQFSFKKNRCDETGAEGSNMERTVERIPRLVVGRSKLERVIFNGLLHSKCTLCQASLPIKFKVFYFFCTIGFWYSCKDLSIIALAFAKGGY